MADSVTRSARNSRVSCYDTIHLEQKLEEKKVVECCMSYLSGVIWPHFNKPPQVLQMQTVLLKKTNESKLYTEDLLEEEEEKEDEEMIYEGSEPEDHEVKKKTSILKSPSVTREKSIDYECSFCIKTFHSKSTFEAHLQTKRHTWKFRRAIERIGRRQKDSTTSLLDSECSDGSLVSSEEGYCTDSDDNKVTAKILSEVLTEKTEVKNSETENLSETKLDNSNSDTNLKTTMHPIDNLSEAKVELPTTNGSMQNGGITTKPEEDTFCEKANNLNNFRHRRTTKERLKRRKMEELKGMYADYAASRGSSDLYKTLLDSYADFDGDDVPIDFSRRNKKKIISDDSKTAISAKSKRQYSVNEKEALMRRDLVLTELADTEKNYVEDLGFVVNDFFPLMEKDGVSEALKNNFEQIFGNIEEIYKFHSKIFLERIDDCLENPLLLNETFCKYEDELSTLYSQYCKSKPYADEALHQHADEMERIRKNYLPDQKLSIKDYLVKPVQRLMKYQLLLTTAKKYSEKSGVNSMAVRDAIDVMDRVPKLANDAMHVELIHGYDGLLQSDDLLFQEVLEVSIGKGNKLRPRQMRVFVFDSVIVFTDVIPRKGRLSTYKCVAKGQASLMGITETIENEPLKFAMWFRKFNSTDIYICQADHDEAKKVWIQMLKDVIALQTILINRSSQHTSLEKIDANKKREGVYRRSSRVKYVNDLVVGETLRQALQGHPRYFQMSERLKNNIEKYILNELIMASASTNDGDNHLKSRSHSMLPISSLVNASEMRPSCRVRSLSTADSPRRDNKSMRGKSSLIESVNLVSFGELDEQKKL